MLNVVKWRKYSPMKFANFVYICITSCKNNHFQKWLIFPARNWNIYKIYKLHRAILSSFYNNSQPNIAILLILDALSSYGNGFHSSGLDQNFIYSWNHPFGVSYPILWSYCMAEQQTVVVYSVDAGNLLCVAWRHCLCTV